MPDIDPDQYRSAGAGAAWQKRFGAGGMVFPIAITSHGVEISDALRADVHERAQHLDGCAQDILACRVLIEAAPRRLHVACHYGVFIRIALPCIEIEAGGKALPDRRHADPHLTVAEAFDALTYRLGEFVRRRCRSCVRYTNAGSGQ